MFLILGAQNLLYKDPSSKPDYRSKTLHELEKLKSHVMLLNDMLDNVDPARPERMVQGDAFDVSIPSVISVSPGLALQVDFRNSPSPR